MLRACRRLLRPGGRTAFLTIFVTPGLSKRDHRRAVRVGPRAVRSDREPQDLLHAARFVDVEALDLTAEFLETARGWHDHSAPLERELRATVGEGEFDQQQADRRETVAAIEDGLLSRALLIAAKPTPLRRNAVRADEPSRSARGQRWRVAPSGDRHKVTRRRPMSPADAFTA